MAHGRRSYGRLAPPVWMAPGGRSGIQPPSRGVGNRPTAASSSQGPAKGDLPVYAARRTSGSRDGVNTAATAIASSGTTIAVAARFAHGTTKPGRPGGGAQRVGHERPDQHPEPAADAGDQQRLAGRERSPSARRGADGGQRGQVGAALGGGQRDADRRARERDERRAEDDDEQDRVVRRLGRSVDAGVGALGRRAVQRGGDLGGRRLRAVGDVRRGRARSPSPAGARPTPASARPAARGRPAGARRRSPAARAARARSARVSVLAPPVPGAPKSTMRPAASWRRTSASSAPPSPATAIPVASPRASGSPAPRSHGGTAHGGFGHEPAHLGGGHAWGRARVVRAEGHGERRAPGAGQPVRGRLRRPRRAFGPGSSVDRVRRQRGDALQRLGLAGRGEHAGEHDRAGDRDRDRAGGRAGAMAMAGGVAHGQAPGDGQRARRRARSRPITVGASVTVAATSSTAPSRISATGPALAICGRFAAGLLDLRQRRLVGLEAVAEHRVAGEPADEAGGEQRERRSWACGGGRRRSRGSGRRARRRASCARRRSPARRPRRRRRASRSRTTMVRSIGLKTQWRDLGVVEALPHRVQRDRDRRRRSARRRARRAGRARRLRRARSGGRGVGVPPLAATSPSVRTWRRAPTANAVPASRITSSSPKPAISVTSAAARTASPSGGSPLPPSRVNRLMCCASRRAPQRGLVGAGRELDQHRQRRARPGRAARPPGRS